MSEHCKDIGVYKKLKPFPVSFFAMIFTYFIFLSIIDGMCIFLIIDFIIQKDYGGMIFAFLTLTVVSFFLVRNVVKNVKYRMDIAKQRSRIRKSLSYNQWSELETEVNNTERFCGTFYFLEKFVYVPKARLMIEYENIRKVTVITHMTDGITDGVKIVIADNNNINYTFWVFNWKRFLEEQPIFEEKISKRVSPEFAHGTEKSNI